MVERERFLKKFRFSVFIVANRIGLFKLFFQSDNAFILLIQLVLQVVDSELKVIEFLLDEYLFLFCFTMKYRAEIIRWNSTPKIF